MDKRILAFAKDEGYVTAVYDCDWKGYKVYKPLFSEDPSQVFFVGPPLCILEKDGEIRMSTVDECFEILDSLPDSDYPD